MKTVLKTSRLTLRETVGEDLEFVAEMLGHTEVMRFWPKIFNPQEARQWIQIQQWRYGDAGYGFWQVMLKDENTPVGQVGLLNQDVEGENEVGLGYIIHKPFWRQGYAYEASFGCLGYAFNHLQVNRVIALIRPENTPSRNLADKLGMSDENTVYYKGFDHTVYAAFRDN
jgi:RimJ/RimL family protein N-acetyltransferase